MTQDFELRRLSDGLIYRFSRGTAENGKIGFKRSDGDYWIVFDADYGWIALDPADQTITGRPWYTHPKDQPVDTPPQGEWVSKKGSKCYVYELVHL